MNLFNFSLQINGFPIKKANHVLKTIENLSENDFDAYVENKKNEIFNYHLKFNTFYKSFANNAHSSVWSSIPILTKKDLQKPLKKRLSKHYKIKDVYVNNTSGASGIPLIFAKNKFCHALTWAIIQNRFGWYNIDFNRAKQARFYGIPLDTKNNFKERLKDKLSNRIRFSVFDLSDTALKKILETFKSKPFNYINGYTSAIVQFAKFLKNENIILKTICPTLKACMVTSEMVFEDDKTLMASQFGIPIINEYGASELDIIAFENPKGDWQVNSASIFVEIIDNNNHVLPYGEPGRIVITSLYNKAHPFIRYDIGDIGILSKKSTTKNPILKTLIGRNNDIAILPSGKKTAGLTFYYITKRIIEDGTNVKTFVIEQTKLNTFKIIYVSSKLLSERKKKIITAEMEKYLEKGLTVIFEKQVHLIRTKHGKLKQFTSYTPKT